MFEKSLMGDARDRDNEVYAIKEGTRETFLIVVDLYGRTRTFSCRVPVISAGTGVHCSNKSKICWVEDFALCS